MIWTGPTDTNNTERDSNGLLITEVAQVRALRIARVYLHSLDHETTIAMLSSYCPGRLLISTVDCGHGQCIILGAGNVHVHVKFTCTCMLHVNVDNIKGGIHMYLYMYFPLPLK